jgi:hypothetical protein
MMGALAVGLCARPSALADDAASALVPEKKILSVDGFMVLGHRNGKELAFYLQDRTRLYDAEYMRLMSDQLDECLNLVQD